MRLVSVYILYICPSCTSTHEQTCAGPGTNRAHIHQKHHGLIFFGYFVTFADKKVKNFENRPFVVNSFPMHIVDALVSGLFY